MRFERVRRLVRSTSLGRKRGVYYECRRCGQSLEGRRDTCRYCDVANVVAYRIE